MPHHLLSLMMNASWLPIKPHDLCALVLVLLLPLRIYLDRTSKIMLVLIGFYLFRSIASEHVLSGLLVTFKLFEYWIVIVSIKMLPNCRQRTILKIFFIIIIFTSILYIADIQLGPNWGGRFFAHLGGPYELSTILLYFLLTKFYPFRKSRTLSVAVNFILLWFTYTKAALLSIMMSRPLLLLIAAFTVATTSFALSFSTSGDRLFDLATDLSNLVSLPIVDICMTMPNFDTREQYFALFNNRNDYNLSELSVSSSQRLFTICVILANANLMDFFLGFGPFFFGTVDNSFLRLATDIGLIGVILGILLLNCLLFPKGIWIKTAFLTSVALSDVFFSGRFLVCLYLVSEVQRNKNEENTHNK